MKIHLHTEESGERAAINQSCCAGEDSGKTGPPTPWSCEGETRNERFFFSLEVMHLFSAAEEAMTAWGRGGCREEPHLRSPCVTTRATATGGWVAVRLRWPVAHAALLGSSSLPSPQLSSTFWVKAATKANVMLPMQKLLLRRRKWRISAARAKQHNVTFQLQLVSSLTVSNSTISKDWSTNMRSN